MLALCWSSSDVLLFVRGLSRKRGIQFVEALDARFDIKVVP
jgi:hypothetical protein